MNCNCLHICLKREEETQEREEAEKENTIKSLVWAVSFELISSLISAALLVLSSLSWMCNVKLEVEMFDNLLFFPPSADQEAVLGVV